LDETWHCKRGGRFDKIRSEISALFIRSITKRNSNHFSGLK